MEWNRFILGDAFTIFPEIENESIDLCFTSPPNISPQYFGKDIPKYQEFQKNALKEMARVTKPTGFVVISQTDRKINGEILSNHITYILAMKDNGFKLKDHKIMVRNYPVDVKDLFYFNYQHTLVFTKKGTIKRSGDWAKNILVYKTDWNGGGSGTGNTKNFSWNKDFVKLILCKLTQENQKVFDPFAGSGIVPWTAKNMNRQYLGIELIKDIYEKSYFNQSSILRKFI